MRAYWLAFRGVRNVFVVVFLLAGADMNRRTMFAEKKKEKKNNNRLCTGA